MKLDEREFHGITEAMTAVQDDYVLTQLERSGAMEMLSQLKGLSQEQRAERSVEAFRRLRESGRKYKLLAGLLTEEGHTWTQTEADTNAARFAAITKTEEKLAMNSEVMRHIALFFRFEGESSETSQKSSSPNGADRDTANAEAPISEASPSLSAA
jgi:hypothetical protein